MVLLKRCGCYQYARTCVPAQRAAPIGHALGTAHRLSRHSTPSARRRVHASSSSNGSRDLSSVDQGPSSGAVVRTTSRASSGHASSSGRTTGADAVTAAGITLPMGAAARAATPLEAFKEGALGFGFSAGGLLFPHYIGVCMELQHLHLLDERTALAGASAGSLIAACFRSGLSLSGVQEACLDLARDCRRGGTRFRLGPVLDRVLRENLPEDAHLRCKGTTHVAVTQLLPSFSPQLLSSFHSRDDLIGALLTSCHIPWYFNGDLTTSFRGGVYFDGGITNFLPSPPGAQYAVRVCCFPAQQLTRFGTFDIHPGMHDEPWPYSLQEMLALALEPGSDRVLLQLVEQGRKDARTWAERQPGLLREAAARHTRKQQAATAGVPVLVTPQGAVL